MENVRKQKHLELLTTDQRRSKLVLEQNYHKEDGFQKIDSNIKKTKGPMKKSIYLSMPILDIRKTVMYEYYYDYIKPKYEDNAKLCYMDAYNFIVHIKTKDVYKDIKVDVNHRFDTSNCITKMIIDHYLQEKTKKKNDWTNGR